MERAAITVPSGRMKAVLASPRQEGRRPAIIVIHEVFGLNADMSAKASISWREANLLMEMISDTGRMTSLEVTELNPILDVKNQSGEVAVDVILSAFGKRIL